MRDRAGDGVRYRKIPVEEEMAEKLARFPVVLDDEDMISICVVRLRQWVTTDQFFFRDRREPVCPNVNAAVCRAVDTVLACCLGLVGESSEYSASIIR